MSSGVPSFKVILCGEYGVGKSSIFRRFVDNCFLDLGQDHVTSTIGLDHFTKKFVIFSDHEIELTLWDTAGIERFATLSSSYFHSASVALVCYSLLSRESFSCAAQHVLDAVDQTRTAKIFLCGTKHDLYEQTRTSSSCSSDNTSADLVTDDDVQTLRDQLDHVISGSFTISSKTGEGVTEMFQAIAQLMYLQVDERFDPEKIKLSTPDEENVDFDSYASTTLNATRRCSC